MKRIGLRAALLRGVLCARWAAGADLELLPADFEAAPPGWDCVGGQEFPGHKASLGRDTGVAHGGASCRLRADCTARGVMLRKTKDEGRIPNVEVRENLSASISVHQRLKVFRVLGAFRG